MFIIIVLLLFFFIFRYRRSNYRNESGVGLARFLLDKGSHGEGLIFNRLMRIKCYSKIVANIYLPTENGTTEIDLIFIAPSGLYVIESKNYSGWIFGDESSKYWTSVIYKTKNRFYNPIWQNRTHIKHLKTVLGDVHAVSIIVFSERCEFKKLDVGNNIVIKRRHLEQIITDDLHRTIYSNAEIDHFYNTLRQYSHKSKEVKYEHIINIRKRR